MLARVVYERCIDYDDLDAVRHLDASHRNIRRARSQLPFDRHADLTLQIATATLLDVAQLLLRAHGPDSDMIGIRGLVSPFLVQSIEIIFLGDFDTNVLQINRPKDGRHLQAEIEHTAHQQVRAGKIGGNRAEILAEGSGLQAVARWQPSAITMCRD